LPAKLVSTVVFGLLLKAVSGIKNIRPVDVKARAAVR
jgi:hypothetical protein